jgi:N-acetylgalactosamine-6-sulfatase
LPAQLDSEDVSDIWLGKIGERRKPLFWKTSSPGSSASMRSRNWKLHVNSRRGEAELYDLARDPSESKNVAQQRPHIRARLEEKIQAWMAELPESYEKRDAKKKRNRD